MIFCIESGLSVGCIGLGVELFWAVIGPDPGSRRCCRLTCPTSSAILLNVAKQFPHIHLRTLEGVDIDMGFRASARLLDDALYVGDIGDGAEAEANGSEWVW